MTKIDSKSPDFKNVLQTMCPVIDFAFIDACHSYEGIKSDFDSVYPLLSKTGIISFDDTLYIDGCREFFLDLRTKFYDGTFDVISFPYKISAGVNYGTTFLVKRSYPVTYHPICEVCGSPSKPEEIIRREKEWYESELQKYRK